MWLLGQFPQDLVNVDMPVCDVCINCLLLDKKSPQTLSGLNNNLFISQNSWVGWVIFWLVWPGLTQVAAFHWWVGWGPAQLGGRGSLSLEASIFREVGPDFFTSITTFQESNEQGTSAHRMPVLPYLLKSQWPKCVMWPSPGSVWEGAIPRAWTLGMIHDRSLGKWCVNFPS